MSPKQHRRDLVLSSLPPSLFIGDRSVIEQDVNSQTASLRGSGGGALKSKGVCLLLSFKLQGTGLLGFVLFCFIFVCLFFTSQVGFYLNVSLSGEDSC